MTTTFLFLWIPSGYWQRRFEDFDNVRFDSLFSKPGDDIFSRIVRGPIILCTRPLTYQNMVTRRQILTEPRGPGTAKSKLFDCRCHKRVTSAYSFSVFARTTSMSLSRPATRKSRRQSTLSRSVVGAQQMNLLRAFDKNFIAQVKQLRASAIRTVLVQPQHMLIPSISHCEYIGLVQYSSNNIHPTTFLLGLCDKFQNCQICEAQWLGVNDRLGVPAEWLTHFKSCWHWIRCVNDRNIFYSSQTSWKAWNVASFLVAHRKFFCMNLTVLIYKICNHTFKPDWGGIQPSPKHQPNFLQVPVHITP